MAYIAELQIKVDTTQLDQATKSLQELSKISPNVERSTDNIASGFKGAEAAADSYTAAQERLINRAREQVATFGQGTTGVLQYRAGLLNVSNVVDPLVGQLRNLKTEQQAVTASQKEQDTINKAIARSQESLSASQYKLIESLKEEIAIFGKSREEVALYRAGLIGVKDQVEPLVAELQRLKKAKEEETRAGKDTGTNSVSRRRAEKEALAEQARELEEVIRLERERIRAVNEANGAGGAGPDVSRTREASAALERYETQLTEVNQRQKQTDQSADALGEEYTALKYSIDPVSKSLDDLNLRQSRLRELYKGGQLRIPQQEYQQLNKILDDSRKRVSDLGATTGKTAKEINFALRGLPAQFTDIAVSLQGGQAPLTVFLQQGGQIKDMFGGVGPALRAMAGYIASIITPATLAAAAVGTLAVGFVLGSKEASNFNKTLIATGNASGTTVNNFLNIQRTLDDTITTSGKAATVLNQIAAAGNITAGSFDQIAKSAILWEQATGTATEDTIKAFSSLRGDPVKAVEELDEKYNFLTASLYRQITALQEQKRTAEATALAEDALAETLISRAKDIEENLGLVESAWNFVAKSAKEGWDAILDVGRTQSPEQKLKDLYSLLQDYDSAGVNNESARRLRAEVTNLQEQIAQAESDALFARADKITKDAAVAGQKRINGLISDGKTKAEQEKAAYAQLEKDITANRVEGIEISEEEISKARAAIAEKFKERKSKSRADTVREDAATKLLSTLKQQEASLTSQRDSTLRLGTEAQKLAKLQQQISDIEEKSKTEKLTKEQQSLLANKEILLVQQQTNTSIESEIKAREQVNRLKGISISLDQQLANDQQRYTDNLIGGTVSDRDATRLKERNRLEQEYQKQLSDAGRRLSNGDIDDNTYQQETELYKRSLDERLAAQQGFYDSEDAARGNWINGVKKSYANYIEAGSDAAGLTENLFTSAFTNIEQSLTSFVTTGKLSFKDLTVSILSDLAKMATRIAANQILTSIFSSFAGGFGGAAAGATSATVNTGASFAGYAAKGKAYNQGVQFFAKGGAFTNSVVNKPTAFGTGSGLGVMGEAGPEAILPLTRTSDGQLGVKGGGTSSTVLAPVNVSVNTDGGGVGGASTGTESNGRAVQQAVKAECEKAISTGLKPGGQIWRVINGR